MDHRNLPWPDRYWAKVDIRGEDECWPWRETETFSNDGYGRVWHNRKYWNAHSIGLQLHLGRTLEPGMDALHTCDNRPCQNPRHLYEGTNQDNVRDMMLRNRNGQLSLSRHGRARLTDDQYSTILESQSGHAELARALGTTPDAIYQFRRSHGWSRN